MVGNGVPGTRWTSSDSLTFHEFLFASWGVFFFQSQCIVRTVFTQLFKTKQEVPKKVGSTLSPIIMIQWHITFRWKEREHHIGDTLLKTNAWHWNIPIFNRKYIDSFMVDFQLVILVFKGIPPIFHWLPWLWEEAAGTSNFWRLTQLNVEPWILIIIDQWLFLVHLRGGRWHSPSPNWQERYHLYTTYSPCLLGGYMLPTTF